jgi:hypothetical protein
MERLDSVSQRSGVGAVFYTEEKSMDDCLLDNL